ncbi:glutathione S-transferase C-terminal domain-containing protein [Ruegeria meonggei]|uniref:glutathione S-transferase C-terminal domain-containing protein n=1 Tax=Ruegeria meonggei TaxID=1446476 RepID=UPI003671F85E
MFSLTAEKVSSKPNLQSAAPCAKVGFAGAQNAYEEAVTDLFSALDTVEARLEGNAYLVGGQLTEAD